jgi:hypothetical protein
MAVALTHPKEYVWSATMDRITKDTKVSTILQEYGDIADVMELFGVKRVGRYSVRRLATKALTVEWAARVHRVPLEEFLEILNAAIERKQSRGRS